MSLPGDFDLHGGNEGQGLAEPEETSHADSHERAEEGDLNEEANNDDLLADIVEIEGPSSLDTPSTSLQGKRDDIPVTNILVSRLTGMIERCWAFMVRIKRPSIMYMEAAYSAGATRIRIAWITKPPMAIGS